MTDKSEAFQDDLLVLLFHNLASGGIITAFNISVGAISSLFMALHTADPTPTGAQDNLEVTYAGYARPELARSAANWPKQGTNGVDNGGTLTFGQKTDGGSTTATHVSVGLAVSGTTDVIYHGILDTALVINQNVNPQFAIGALVIQEN